MSNEVHVNDIGTEFRITVKDDGVVVDVSGATTTQIIIRKPSGTVLTVSATLYTDGSDGIIYYNAVSGDLDEVGLYKIQAKVVIGAGTFYTSVGSFKVYCNINE